MKTNKNYIKHVSLSLVAILVLMAILCVPTTETQAKTNWKKTYSDYLKKDKWCKEAASSAQLIYINNDTIPEIYLEGAFAAAGNMLLSIYNGKVYANMIDGHGGIFYVPKKGLIHETGGNMDNYFDAVGKLSKGKIKYTKRGSYGAEDNANLQFDSKGNIIYKYYWQNKKVSEKTYIANLKKAKGNYTYKPAGDYDKMITIDQLKKKLK